MTASWPPGRWPGQPISRSCGYPTFQSSALSPTELELTLPSLPLPRSSTLDHSHSHTQMSSTYFSTPNYKDTTKSVVGLADRLTHGAKEVVVGKGGGALVGVAR